MPDLVTSGEVYAEIKKMGQYEFKVRHDAGLLPCSVCLIHGVHPLFVQFAEFTPVLGRGGARAVGKTVEILTVVAGCWQQCGYRLEWRQGGWDGRWSDWIEGHLP